MLEALREVLRRHLGADGRVSLYGQDIEDPKGDVFGLTRGTGIMGPPAALDFILETYFSAPQALGGLGMGPE